MFNLKRDAQSAWKEIRDGCRQVATGLLVLVVIALVASWMWIWQYVHEAWKALVDLYEMALHR